MNTKVFLLQHLNTLPDGSEDSKIIGIYSSRATAAAAIERLRDQPGFSSSPSLIDPTADEEVDGFYIDEYAVDKDNWPEGFVTV